MIAYDWEDDDEELLYENVKWYWDEKSNQLRYKREATEVLSKVPVKTGIVGSLEFRQDIDLNEQQRFRNRFQRKYGPTDVVTLQDIKDVVLLTAPLKIMLPATISMLHLPASDRLIRALIMYCQYFLQISDLLKLRKAELESKIRTPSSDKTEAVFREDIKDLRLLVSKEYCSFITGSGELSKYHHMLSSPTHITPSLGKKERILFENFIRIVVQIIWIALGRKAFTQIEIEVHRLFKSRIFNLAEHNPNNDDKEFWKDLTPKDISILIGHCEVSKRKVNTKSPLMHEFLCPKNIDYRMLGLGVFKYRRMNSRLRYLENALIMPEANLNKNHVSLGILGARRNDFDIMLNVISSPPASYSSTCLLSRSASYRRLMSLTSSAQLAVRQKKTYSQLSKNINIPAKEPLDMCTELSYVSMPQKPIDKVQRSKWLHKVMQKQKSSKESCNRQ